MVPTLPEVRLAYQIFARQVVTDPRIRNCHLGKTEVTRAERELISGHLRRPGRSIDLGFGFGRTFRFLMAAQQKVFGVDQCEESVRETAENIPEAVVTCGQMEQPTSYLPLLGARTFHNLFCLGQAMGGLFSWPEQNEFALACQAMAEPGARLFIDLFDCPPSLANRFPLFDAPEPPVCAASLYSVERGIGGFLRSPEGPVFPQFYPTEGELVTLLASTGFTLTQKQQSFDWGSMDPSRLYVFTYSPAQ